MRYNLLKRNYLIILILSFVLFGLYEYFEYRQKSDEQKEVADTSQHELKPQETLPANRQAQPILLEAVHDLISDELISSSPITFLPKEDVFGVGPDIWYVKGTAEATKVKNQHSRFEYSVAVRFKKDCPNPSSKKCLQIIRKPDVKPIN